MNAGQMSLFEVDQRPPVLKVKRGTMARIKRATGITYPTIKAALQRNDFTIYGLQYTPL